MAKSPFDRDIRRRGATAALALLLTLGWAIALRAPAANFTGDLIVEDSHNLQYTRDGVATADDVVITHGSNTRITAAHARHASQAGRVSELDLTGKVHIEFNDALLDADSAVLKFRGQDLLSVTVQGSQAKFSHLPKGYKRRVDGLADVIEFDSASGKVRFSGHGSYTDGSNSLTSGVVVYDINDGSVMDDGDPKTRGKAIIRLGDPAERVPPPRQPDRSQAQ